MYVNKNEARNFDVFSDADINVNIDILNLLEKVAGKQSQLESLLAVMDNDEFWDYDLMTLRNYAWTMKDLVIQSNETLELIFNKMSV